MTTTIPTQPPDVARAGRPPYEDLFVRYTIGRGRFIEGKKYLSARGRVYLLNGQCDGECEYIYELLTPLSRLGETPRPTGPPYNRPAGPVAQPQPQAYAKGRWSFSGGSVSAIGPAIMHTAELLTTSISKRGNDLTWKEDTIFWISSNQIITNGTGRFDGAQGLKTAAVSVFIPGNISLEEVDEVDVKTSEVFRLVRREFLGTLPTLPTPA
jgi:hypothetical protein